MAKQDLLQREEYVKLLESLINNKVHNHQWFLGLWQKFYS